MYHLLTARQAALCRCTWASIHPTPEEKKMQFTQNAMALLALFWGLQVAGSWVQWTHYRRALRQATARWGDGFLGMGKARSRFGFGVLALLEVDPKLDVRSLQVMSGITVFARFKSLPLVQPTSIESLAAR